MKCMLCGTENRDEAIRCKGCGSSLKGTSAKGGGKRTPAPTVLEGSSQKVPIVPTPTPTPQQPASPAPSIQQPQVGPAQPAPPTGGKRKTQFVPPEELGVGNRPQQAPTPQPTPQAATQAQPAGARRTTADAKRKTVYVPPEGLPSVDRPPSVSGSHVAHQGRPSQPRLTGFLVSFTWDTSGQWFPIREGKNFFGTKPDADGSVPNDVAMSSEHFVVHCRGKRVVVKDLGSTNATFVDDEELSYEHTDAHQGAVIRAGDTLFQLMLVPPLPGSE